MTRARANFVPSVVWVALVAIAAMTSSDFHPKRTTIVKHPASFTQALAN
jgi:hypothetical protein